MTTQTNPARPRNGPQVSDPLATEDEVRTLLFNRISWGALVVEGFGNGKVAAVNNRK